MLLTPPGAAALAVLRLAGPGVADFLRRHVSKSPQPGMMAHATLFDGARIMDDPIVVRVEDDVVDLNLHGGAWIVRNAIDLAERRGFGRVEGDQRTYDADDEIQQEILQWLPQARTELAIRALLAQPAAWKNKTRPRDELLADRALHWLLNPPCVTIVGAANVGKSTLANQLFAQERSITADVPGTTRDWVGQIANIDGLAVMLIDTPGLRVTDDAIERAAIDIAGRQIASADMVILVLDAARPMDDEQRALLSRFAGAQLVVNRVDLPHAWGVASVDACRTIATTGHGVDDLRLAIQRKFGCADFDESLQRIWTQRQRQIVERVSLQSDGCLDDAH